MTPISAMRKCIAAVEAAVLDVQAKFPMDARPGVVDSKIMTNGAIANALLRDARRVLVEALDEYVEAFGEEEPKT